MVADTSPGKGEFCGWMRGFKGEPGLDDRRSGVVDLRQRLTMAVATMQVWSDSRATCRVIGWKFKLLVSLTPCTLRPAFGGEVAEWFKAHAWKA